MAKRFFETSMFSSPYIRGLGGAYKLLWIYMMQTCDHAGVWDVELDIASVRCGFEYTAEGCKNAFGDGIHECAGGAKWFMPAFIEEQYNGTLNPNNQVHASVLRILEKFSLNDIINKKNEPLDKPLPRGLQGAINNNTNKDKEKDKVKDKEKEDRGTGKETNSTVTDEPDNDKLDYGQNHYILKKTNVTPQSMLLIDECKAMFLYSDLCTKARDTLCMNRHINIKDPAIASSEFERLKAYVNAFNEMHTTRLEETMLLQNWCNHFSFWTGKIDLTIDPKQLFKNNGTANKQQQRTPTGRNTNAASIIVPGRGFTD